MGFPAGRRQRVLAPAVRYRMRRPAFRPSRSRPQGPTLFTKDRFMAKEELIEMNGLVTEVLPDSRYRVTLDNGTC